MKKGLYIALLVVLVLIFAALIANLANGGIWIIEGLNGKDGADGEDGLNGINGIDGTNGKDGVDGEDGKDGKDGKSAYDLAVEDGFRGSLHEWLLSLAVKGSNGTDGAPGNDGVGVKDVKVNADGYLIVTLTNGVVLNAGQVGGDGYVSDTPDEDGYYSVYETVIMTGAEALRLRLTPDTSNGVILTSIPKGTELLRVGDERTDDGFSRLVYNGQVCYARSRYFEIKYVYDGEIPEIHLPDHMVLTEGKTTWFMTDQILLDRTVDFKVCYSYSGSGEKYHDGDDAFAVTPAWKTASSGTHKPENATLTVRVEKRVDGELRTITEKQVAITVVAEQKSLSLTGLFIGDSRISDGTIVGSMASTMSGLELIGTKKSGGGIPHEGRGSWSAEDYLHEATVKVGNIDVTNAFYDPSTQKFNFTYYMNTHHSGKSLDFVVINLGANDRFSKESTNYINEMVASIRAYSEDIKILVMTEYLSPSDGYYISQSTVSDVNAWRNRQFDYFSYLSETFEGREEEGIYLLPNYLSINAWSDWTRTTVNTANGEEERVSDVVHLGMAGYRKEAECVRAYLYWLFGVQP